MKCSLKLSNEEHSLHLAPQILQSPGDGNGVHLCKYSTSSWSFMCLLEVNDSNKGECEGLGLIWLLNQSVKIRVFCCILLWEIGRTLQRSRKIYSFVVPLCLEIRMHVCMQG